MTDRIKAIAERCETALSFAKDCDRTNNGCQVPQVLKLLEHDIPYLLTEIDRLNAELLQKTQQLEAYTNTDLTPDEFKQSVDYVLELNKKCAEATGCTAEEIASLRVALAASQRREQAAVEFIEWFNYAFCYCMPVEYQVRYKEWRGPQEGGE